jgi:hypothetical protein
VTIRTFRLYLEFDEHAVARAMNRTHFGAADFIGSRLNRIREELRGAEAKGVDIVNVYFFESPARCNPCDSWYRLLNAFEYKLVYDLNSLVDKDPIENIEHLLQLAAKLCGSAPWPQVRAIGKVLHPPLGAEKAKTLGLCLKNWSSFVDRASKLN